MFIIVIIALMLGGIAVGYLTRNHKLDVVHRIITLLIWALLFLLGIEVGNNKSIINGLHTIGLQALIITLGAVAGSVLASWGLWYWVRKSNRKREANV